MSVPRIDRPSGKRLVAPVRVKGSPCSPVRTRFARLRCGLCAARYAALDPAIRSTDEP